MDPLNVLVVVDVQNCFMFSSDDKANFLNLGFGGKDNSASQAIANEIAELTTKNDIVVFTRDYHPINHISFDGDEGRKPNIPNTWPRHCRNKNRVCSDRTKVEVVSPMNVSIPGAINGETKLIDALKANFDSVTLNKMFSDENDLTWLDNNMTITGTDLSYFFYNTTLKNIISRLTQSNKLGDFKIGLASTLDETAQSPPVDSRKIVTLDDIAWENVLPMEYNNTKFVTLTKGEDCSRESYSAFNYHIDYNTYDANGESLGVKNPSAPEVNYGVSSIKKENSTGLWEWILKQNGGATRKIIITVCGLVGNVCVMHTVLQGMTMWEQLYKKDNSGVAVEFVLSLKGTRFTDTLPPFNVNPGIDDLTIFQNERNKVPDYIPSPFKSSYIGWMKFNLPINRNGEKYEFPQFRFADSTSALFELGPIMNKADVNDSSLSAVGGKRTRRMKMRKTRKQHKKQCKCASCVCKKRKSTRRTRRSHRRR